MVLFFWGGFLLMGSTSLIQVSENFCFPFRHPAALLPQETQLLLSYCLPEPLFALYSKTAVSVRSLLPASLTRVLLTHKIPVISSSHLIMTCCQHYLTLLSVGVPCRTLGRYQNLCGQVHSIEGYSILSHTFI